jgi:signal transduction histidine kinase
MSLTPTPPRFQRLVISAILIPIALLIGIAVLLIGQINRLLVVAALANHSDDVIATANDLQKETIDLETGLRGYLVTGEPDFLDPYVRSLKLIRGDGGIAARLHALVRGNLGQEHLVDEMDQLRDQWLNYAQKQIDLKQRGGDVVAVARERVGKELMDTIRAKYAAFIRDESAIREQRDQQVTAQSQFTLWLTAALAVFGGGLLGWISRRQILALSKTYSGALQTANELNEALEQRVAERTNELRLRSEQLADANRELEAFAYSISHDLRAPMRHISGFVELLRKSAGAKLNAGEQDFVSTIFQTARLAGKMVDDLLAFSRVGRAHLKFSRIDMNALVEQCRKDLQLDMTNRQIEWHISPLPPAWGDPILLKMAVQNLLSNAVKYSSKQSVARIEVGVLKVADDRDDETETAENFPTVGESPAPSNWATYFVSDNGVGFDMAYATKLFGVFQRLHRAEEFEGTGIGLANVRRIIMRHGGRIRAEATPGKGATFFFTLPVDVSQVPENREPDQAHTAG